MDFDIFPDITENISQVIFGKARCIRPVLMDLLAEDNVLLEDVPGVGKNVLDWALAKSMDGPYKRVQSPRTFCPHKFSLNILPEKALSSKINYIEIVSTSDELELSILDDFGLKRIIWCL